MSIFKRLAAHLLAILTGYDKMQLQMRYVEEAVRKSDAYVEAHVGILNGEMGRIERRLDSVAEDVAYIKGRLDK